MTTTNEAGKDFQEQEREHRTAEDAMRATLARVIRERDDLKAKLDAELPAAWREDLASLNECLDRVERERDELKSRLAHAEADAEQAIHNEAFMERQKIAKWLRTTPRARGVLISIHSSQDIARCADAIERGEHER